MKIIYSLAGTFNSGGMERIVIEKANWLAKKGHHITIITTEQAGRPDFFKLNEGITRIDLDIKYSDTIGFNPIKKYVERRKRLHQHFQKLSDIVKEVQPDVLISTFGNEVGLLPKLKYPCPMIAEIHFSRWFRLQSNRSGIWRWINRYLTRQDYKTLSSYDKFVCLTEEDKRNWTGIDNIVVIPNFIAPPTDKQADLKNHSMIAVGRLSYQKGYDRMIKAWGKVIQAYPNWKLNIFGNGEMKEEIEKLISQLHLNEVITIHQPTKDIESQYLNNSALVLSSHYEGLPMVLLEAMRVGLPPITFACQCGPKDIIKNGYNGLLVKEGDIDGLAQAIIETIRNKDLRYMLGQNALKESSRYTIEQIMPRWVKLLESVTTTYNQNNE